VRKAVLGGVLALSISGAALVVERALAAPSESPEQILSALERSPIDGPITADTRVRVKRALQQAATYREKGDEARARLAEGLAQKLANLAQDQARTARIERATETSLRSAQDAGATVDRERALVEEALAQGGRLRAQLEGISAEKKREPERTATRVLSDVSDGGAPKAPKAVPAPTQPKAGRDGGAP